MSTDPYSQLASHIIEVKALYCEDGCGIRGILTDPAAPTAEAPNARHAEPVVSIDIKRTPFGKIPLNIGNISGRSSA